VALEQVKAFEFSHIISSPIGRALNLAEAIGNQSVHSITLDPRLEEMNHGILEGMTVEEAEKKYPKVVKAFMDDFETIHFPEGESYEMFSNRIYEVMDELVTKGENCLIVSHGGVVRTALEYLLEFEAGMSWHLEIGNCSFVEIELNEGRSVIKTLINPIVVL
jgi:broad specificity phosphatase PhoE